jgi:FkbM family methyltransferase
MRIRNEGIIKSIRHTLNYLLFTLKIKYTKGRLTLLKLIKKPPLIISHGRYKLYFNDDGDYEEILCHAHWKKYFTEESNNIKSYIQEGNTVIDIGANIGLFTFLLSDLVGLKGKVYSYEPCAVSFEKLNKNKQLNNLKNVEIFQLGMGSKEDTLEIHFHPQQCGLSSIVERVSENCISEKITITTLDRLSSELIGKTSFIKIDTEGYESEVLMGGINLLQKDRPVLYLELGGKYQQASHKALEILKKIKYECEAYSIDLSTVPPGKNFIALPEEYAV